MSSSPRRPAIAGAAQFVQRIEDPRDSLDPLGMMERALRDAAEDAGAPKLLEAIDSILIPRGTWKYGNPGAMLGERVGAGSVETGLGIISGHIVQVLMDWACTEIAAGRRDVIAIVGDTLFVHGGVLPGIVDYGIDRLNTETRAWMRGDAERPEVTRGEGSPVLSKSAARKHLKAALSPQGRGEHGFSRAPRHSPGRIHALRKR